jgi:hypothetical protein
MVIAFEHGRNEYALTFAPRRGAQSLRLDVDAARRLLTSPAARSTRMRELRSLLTARSASSAVSRMTDAEVVDLLAANIASRRLLVYAEVVRRETRGYRAEEKLDEVLGPMAVEQAEEPAAEHLDVPEQVAVMQAAARDGVPFCEECEKARLEEEAAAAAPQPNPYAGTDVAAQSAVMSEAAATGAPFCEECEKARLEEEAAAKSPAPEPDPYAGTDVAAQAAAMQKAATNGTPFCEECEKARLAAKSAEPAEPDPYAGTDAAAQAAVMKNAAQDGTPVCEECEKARKAAEGS